MKKPLLVLIGVVLFNTTLPVLAGPNWALIEDGRKAHAGRMHQGSSNEVTPQQQESKNAKMQKMMKGCHAMMNQS